MQTNHEASRHELEATQSVNYHIKSQEVLIYLDLSPCFEEIKIIIYLCRYKLKILLVILLFDSCHHFGPLSWVRAVSVHTYGIMVHQTSWIPKLYPKTSYMVKFWSQFIQLGLRYGTASIVKNFFLRGCVDSNIIDS